MPHFIVGYGSLISLDSRKKSGLSETAVPMSLEGYGRGWYVQARNNRTYLGVLPSPGKSINGVLFSITSKELEELDKREGAYDRVEVNNASIKAEHFSPTDTAWIYLPKKDQVKFSPSPHFPVSRRYVDDTIAGCLDYGEEYAARFIKSTSLWLQYWRNNRIRSNEIAQKIDQLVGEYYPESMKVEITRQSSNTKL